MPAANSLIGECHEKTKGTAMAIHQTALYCGMIGSGAVAGWLGVRYGWRSPFFIFGALGVLWAVVLFFGLKEPNARVAGRSGNRVSLAEAASRVFGSARILAMGVVFGCIVFCNVGYITWIPTLLHEKFGLSLAAAGFTSMLWHVLCAIGGVMAGGRVSDWLRGRTEKGRLAVLAAGFAGCIPFLAMMGLAPSLFLAVAGLSLFGFFRGMCDATFFPSLIEMIVPAYRSALLGSREPSASASAWRRSPPPPSSALPLSQDSVFPPIQTERTKHSEDKVPYRIVVRSCGGTGDCRSDGLGGFRFGVGGALAKILG